MMKSKIILISHNQFGYQISHYKYATHLKEHFQLSYYCLDYLKPRIKMENVNIVYIKVKKNRLLRLVNLSFSLIKLLRKEKKIICIVKYYPTCSLLTLFRSSSIVVDVQTASVSKNPITNLFLNVILKFETLFFKKVTVLSESLKSRLKLRNALVVPIGADPIGYSEKRFDKLSLLYVGVFYSRQIHKTIAGLRLFLDKHPALEANYTIIGYGTKYEEEEILNSTIRHKLQNIVNYKGFIHHSGLEQFFLTHNVGVSFVPMTKYFDKQPPTKTYEYLAAGMPVIATNTFENRAIINQDNGVLIPDNPEEFSIGLEFIWRNRKKYYSKTIAGSVSKYSYKYSVLNVLLPLINSLDK